jgi:hypothetical protein
MTNLVERIGEATNDIINDHNFKESSRKRVQDFTRNRGMKFENVVRFTVMRLRDCSTSTALRRFFKKFIGTEPISQQALSLSRYKIKVQAFVTLFASTVEVMLGNCHKNWHGYRILATDGSKIALPDEEALLLYYGGVGCNANSPTAQGSILLDVLNDIVVDAKIMPLSTDERTLAKMHIDDTRTLLLGEKELMIYDRGYPSYDLIKKLEAMNIKYVMRVKRKFNVDIDAQTKSDGYVWLKQGNERIHVRVIKFALDSGEEEVLITNITDKRLGTKAFKKLYFIRWPVETKYNIAKSKLNIECFTATLKEGIEQDFYATMYLINVTAAAKIDAQPAIDAAHENTDNLHSYKANTSELIGILKDELVEALLEDDNQKRAAIVSGILATVKKHTIPKRDNRSVPRNPNPRKVRFHHNRKSNC